MKNIKSKKEEDRKNENDKKNNEGKTQKRINIQAKKGIMMIQNK